MTDLIENWSQEDRNDLRYNPKVFEDNAAVSEEIYCFIHELHIYNEVWAVRKSCQILPFSISKKRHGLTFWIYKLGLNVLRDLETLNNVI